MMRSDGSLDFFSGRDSNIAEAGYFDQVEALSQEMINARFKDLFEQAYVDGTAVKIATMYHCSPRGTIDAVLDAPSIIIDDDSAMRAANMVYYVLWSVSAPSTGELVQVS
jgi:hypothetical protein